MKPVSHPPKRENTPRQAILDVLGKDPMTALEMSGLAGISEKNVIEHMAHLIRSGRRGGRTIVVTPAHCHACGFVFAKRTKLTRPGRCPQCKERRTASPRFSVK